MKNELKHASDLKSSLFYQDQLRENGVLQHLERKGLVLAVVWNLVVHSLSLTFPLFLVVFTRFNKHHNKGIISIVFQGDDSLQ